MSTTRLSLLSSYQFLNAAFTYLRTYLPTTLTLSFSCRSLTGVFTADNTRKRLANIPGSNKEGLEKFVVKKYYKVDLANNPTLGAVSRMLDIAPYVVVVKTGNRVSYAQVRTNHGHFSHAFSQLGRKAWHRSTLLRIFIDVPLSTDLRKKDNSIVSVFFKPVKNLFCQA